uniref:Putative transmembrane protein n=1 Tax=Toxoplasma gondii COUG TaxID=1074873 RepID=A0A2G8XR67_TOXGO|nr:putative transmembrane protein [Toxoplasma gondii COUG]
MPPAEMCICSRAPGVEQGTLSRESEWVIYIHIYIYIYIHIYIYIYILCECQHLDVYIHRAESTLDRGAFSYQRVSERTSSFSGVSTCVEMHLSPGSSGHLQEASMWDVWYASSVKQSVRCAEEKERSIHEKQSRDFSSVKCSRYSVASLFLMHSATGEKTVLADALPVRSGLREFSCICAAVTFSRVQLPPPRAQVCRVVAGGGRSAKGHRCRRGGAHRESLQKRRRQTHKVYKGNVSPAAGNEDGTSREEPLRGSSSLHSRENFVLGLPGCGNCVPTRSSSLFSWGEHGQRPRRPAARSPQRVPLK